MQSGAEAPLFIFNYYMVIRQKRRTNRIAITVTAMSFFLNLPAQGDQGVSDAELIPIPLEME